MNITPIDIQQAGFKVRIRGYDRREVDTFLDLLTDDFETLIKQNSAMKEKVSDLESQVREFKKREAALNNTLVRAEEMVGQMQQNAQKEAKLITKKAEVDAEGIVKDARNHVADIHRDIQDLKKQKLICLEKIRSMINSFQKLVEFESEQEGHASHGSRIEDSPSVVREEKRENTVSVLRPKP